MRDAVGNGATNVVEQARARVPAPILTSLAKGSVRGMAEAFEALLSPQVTNVAAKVPGLADAAGATGLPLSMSPKARISGTYGSIYFYIDRLLGNSH